MITSLSYIMYLYLTQMKRYKIHGKCIIDTDTRYTILFTYLRYVSRYLYLRYSPALFRGGPYCTPLGVKMHPSAKVYIIHPILR